MNEITTDELKELLSENPKLFLIDVREEGEYKSGHVKEAKHFALSEFSTENFDKKFNIPKDQAIYIICQSGRRSANTCQMLSKSNYTNTYNIAGGTSDWIMNGFEIVKN